MKRLLLFCMPVCVLAWAQEPADPGSAAPNAPDTQVSSMLERAQDVLEHVEDPAALALIEDLPPAAGNGPRVLTVDDCVALALEQNPQIYVARDDVEAAQARIGQASAQRWPHVTAHTTFVHSETSSYDALGGAFLGDALGGLGDTEDMRTDGVTVSQVVYAGGQIRAAIKAAKHLAQSQEWRKVVVQDALTYDAKQAYYDCLLAEALVNVAQDSVVTFERHLSDTEEMLEVGVVGGFEVLRARTELGARQADLITAKNGVRLAMANLRRVLALPQDTAIRLAGDLDWQPLTAASSQLVEQAHVFRPEIQAIEKAVEAAQQDLRRTRGLFKPRAAAAADYTHADGGTSLTPDGWTFSLTVEWDILTGNSRAHQVAERKAQLRSLEHQLEDLKHLVELDVRQAHIRVQDAIAQIRSEKGTVELAREGKRLASLRFQEGVGTQAELLDAELALTNAETALVRALRNYAVALAALDKAVGINPNRPGPAGDIAAGAPHP